MSDEYHTMNIFNPYYNIAKQFSSNIKILLDRFFVLKKLRLSKNHVYIYIMNQFNRKAHEYQVIKRY